MKPPAPNVQALRPKTGGRRSPSKQPRENTTMVGRQHAPRAVATLPAMIGRAGKRRGGVAERPGVSRARARRFDCRASRRGYRRAVRLAADVARRQLERKGPAISPAPLAPLWRELLPALHAGFPVDHDRARLGCHFFERRTVLAVQRFVLTAERIPSGPDHRAQGAVQ